MDQYRVDEAEAPLDIKTIELSDGDWVMLWVNQPRAQTTKQDDCDVTVTTFEQGNVWFFTKQEDNFTVTRAYDFYTGTLHGDLNSFLKKHPEAKPFINGNFYAEKTKDADAEDLANYWKPLKNNVIPFLAKEFPEGSPNYRKTNEARTKIINHDSAHKYIGPDGQAAIYDGLVLIYFVKQ